MVDQDVSRVLNPGEIVEREIRRGEVHRFNVSLAPMQYVRLVVQRRGIDLFVNVIAPERPPVKYENPAGAQSPIFALIKGEIPGSYVVEIWPTNKWLVAGRYEIRFDEVREPNISDERRLLAQQKMIEGRRNQRRALDNSNLMALVNYEKALELWREVGDAFQEANTLHYIAQTYQAQEDFESAEDYYTRALVRRSDDREARAYTLLDLADAYYTLNGRIASLPHYEKARAAFKENSNSRGYAITLSQLGLIYIRKYDWERARTILQEALDIDRSEGNTYEEMRVLNALGGVSDNQGQPEKAMELYQQALEGFREVGASMAEGNVYINIGLLYDGWGEWREAFASYNQALDLLAANEGTMEADHKYITEKKASAFYNIGTLYVSLGDFAEGLNYLQKSLDLRTKKEQGGTLMWFGYAYVLSDEPKKALEFCDRAIDIQENANDPRRAQSYTVIGMAHDALGMHDKAVEFFNKALEIQQNIKTLDLKGQAITLDKRGFAFAALGETTKARRDFEDALDLWRTFKDRNGEAQTLFQSAAMERDVGNFQTALGYAEEAIRLTEPLRANVMDQQLRASYFASKVDYYEMYIDLNMKLRTANDVERTAAGLEASERERARTLLDMISVANVEAQSLTDPALGVLVEKRRLLQRSILIKSAQQSDSLSKTSGAKFISLDVDLVKLSAEEHRLEEQITSRYPHYAALVKPEPLTANEIRQQLDRDTTLLEYSLGEKRSYVWAVTPDSIKGFELRGREEIESTALRLNKSLTERNREVKNEGSEQRRLRLAEADTEYTEASLALSKLVIEPVAALLGNKRLVIVADGALQLVAFGALTTQTATTVSIGLTSNAKTPRSDAAANNRRSLIEDHEIVYQPSASVLALQRRELDKRKPALHAVAVLADPVFDQADSRVRSGARSDNSRGATADQKQQESIRRPESSARNPTQPSALTRALRDVGLGEFSWLPYSRDEAQAIIKLAPKGEGKAALGFEASRATAMSPELSKYRIIHFATHGVVDFEHPELSGIVLSMVDEKGQPVDGYLRLHEIYNLNLPADLVVLSACQTGIGKQIKGEGLIALTRGFMYAGAQRVVASLWKVDDAATAELMAEFYKQMFTNHEKPATALRAAQLRISQIKRWRSPYYWAGFVLQGEWK